MKREKESSDVLVLSKNQLSVPKDKPSFNQWTAMVSEDAKSANNEEQEVEKSPIVSAGINKKKPFLARGSGKAGGGRGLQNSNQKTPLRE